MTIKKDINYYEILGISANADLGMIKSAYRRLVRKYHPDLNPDNKESCEKFKQVAEAYETLSNSFRREVYDKMHGYGERKSTNTFNSEAAKTYSERKPSPYRKTYKTPNEPKNAFGEIFNDILDSFKRPSKKSSAAGKTNRGSDIYMDIVLTAKEAHEGTLRTINIIHTTICHNCFGRKFINGTKCVLCQGRGETSVQKKINVKIPPHVHDGSKIRIANEGNQGKNGGVNGDLYLTVMIEHSDKFTCEGNNVFADVQITPYEAALGTNLEVPTPNGVVMMKIPKCTNSGQKFRLAGQGLNGEGDLVVSVKICFPKELSEQEEMLYEQLKSLSGKA